MKQYESYLFDADGTLIDTIELIYRCFKYSLKKFGNIDATREQIVTHVGLPLRKQFELYLGPLSDPRAKAVMDAHMEYQLSICEQYLTAFPTVAEGLARLKQAGAKLAVVTSRRTTTLTLYLRKTGLYRYFDAFVTPESTDRHKPDPAPALKALEMLGGESATAIMVGDSNFDIECGANAGTDTAFVTWSHNPVSSLAVTPTYVIDDLRALVAH